MRKIWAIATITVRSVLRSRVFLTLGGVLVLSVVALPLTIRGDGTMAGHVQILLRYALGASFVLLGIAMVWSGCAAISTEIRDRQMHLVATKPIHPLAIWAGKWLGLLMVQAMLLALAGAGVYGLLHWTTRPSAVEAEETDLLFEQILVAQHYVAPVPPEVEAEARSEIRRRIEENRLPPEGSAEEALETLRRTLRQRAFSVSPGGRTEWVFRLPVAEKPDRLMVLQFRFEKSVMDMEPVQGRWTFQGGRGDAAGSVTGAYRPQSIQTVPVPSSAWDGSGTMVIGFENTDPVPTALLIDPDDGLVLRIYRGGFAANYVRAILILFFRLAFLTALGLAAGTLFSLPIAAFTSVSFLLFVLLHDYIEAMSQAGAFFASGPDAGIGWVGLDRLFSLVFSVLAAVVRPLRGADPLDWLAGGRWISGSFVAHEFLIQTVVYGGALALVCAGLFRRRELGLPT